MFTLEELLFIKFYATEVNPQILAYMSQKNHSLSESFYVYVMDQLVWMGIRKILHVTDPPNSRGWHWR